MFIHQIYIDFNTGYWDPIFTQSKASWSEIPGTTYKLWGEEDLEELINKYPIIKNIWNNITKPIQKIDLGRWVILYHFGGLYTDLDVVNKDQQLSFIDTDHFVTTYKNKIETDIIYFDKPQHPLLKNLFEYFVVNIKKINAEPIYRIWRCRYILQSFGPRAIARYFRINKLKPNIKEFEIRPSPFIFTKKIKPFKVVDNSPVIIYKTSSWNVEANNI